MSVTSVTNTKKCSLTTNEHGQPTYNISFQVITDSLNDGPLTAEGAIGVNLGDYFAFGGVQDTRAVCTGASTQTVEEYEKNGTKGFVYEVTLTYSQLENGQTPSNPLNSPAEFSWSFDKQEEIVDYDIYGNPITNSAYDPYDPPVTRDSSRLRLTVSQNESFFNAGLAMGYQNAINSDAWQGALPGQVKVENIGATGPHYSDDFLYYKVTYDFAYRYEGWAKEILDAGYRELDDSNNRQHIKVKGENVTSPHPLNGVGKASTTNGAKRTHDIYRALPFGGVFNFRY